MNAKYDFLNRDSYGDLSLTNYYWFDAKGFTEEEVTRIIEVGDSLSMKQGTIFSKNKVSESKARDSKVCWIYQDEKTEWLYNKLFKMTKEANNNCWNFNLTGFNEACQYAHYEAPTGHYDYHLDIDGGNGDKDSPAVTRKISVVVQLSDPSEYEGGELTIQPGNKTIKRGLGITTLFPSYLLHKVTPVTKGLRKSLVMWVSGPPFA